MKPPASLYGSSAQAAALAEVIELEARWRNLPAAVVTDDLTMRNAALVAKQEAYDEFREVLRNYNRLYWPTYLALPPRVTAASLARWCRSVADLIGGAGLTKCPTEVLEDAFRRAEKLARRMGVDEAPRPLAADSVADVVAALVAMAHWAEGLTGAPADPVAA